MLGIHQCCMINKWLWKRQVYQEMVFPGELPAVSINRCAQKHSHRKTGGRERVRKMTREERTPSWLDPGKGRDVRLPSKRNSHVQNLQLKPFTSHRLPVNRGGHGCILRGFVSQPCHRLLSPCHQQHFCLGLQLPCTARKVENKRHCSSALLEIPPWHALTATQNEETASGTQPAHSSSPRWRCQVVMHCCSVERTCISYFIWARKPKWSLKIPRGYCPADLIRILWHFYCHSISKSAGPGSMSNAELLTRARFGATAVLTLLRAEFSGVLQ